MKLTDEIINEAGILHDLLYDSLEFLTSNDSSKEMQYVEDLLNFMKRTKSYDCWCTYKHLYNAFQMTVINARVADMIFDTVPKYLESRTPVRILDTH